MPLSDFFKRSPREVRQPRKPSSREIGTSFVNNSGGESYLLEDSLLDSLSGSRGALTYRQMSESSPIIGGILYAIRMFLDSVVWRIDETEDTKEEGIEFMEQVLFEDMDHSWNEFISNSLSFFVFGFSLSELVYKVRMADNSIYPDGKVGLAKIAHRPQESIYKWVYDSNGNLEAVEQYTNTQIGIARMPMDKCVHFRTSAERGAPDGRSLLRNAYRSWYFARNVERIEAIGIERELAGLPVMKIPDEILRSAAAGDATAVATRNAYLDVAKNVRFNEQGGILIPSDTYLDGEDKPTSIPKVELQLLSSGGSRSIDTNSIVMRHEINVARSMMADFVMLGTSSGGAYSLGKDKSTIFEHCLKGWLTILKDTIQRQVVVPVWAMNGNDMDAVPVIGHSPLLRESLTEFSSSLEQLSRAGMSVFPSETMEEFIRDRFDWPQMTKDELALLDKTREVKEMGLNNAPKAGDEGNDGGNKGAGGDLGQE